MKYYDQLLRLGVFTFEDIKKLTGSQKAASYIATAYSKKGYIKKIKRNLYAAISLDTNDVVANRFKIGCSVTSDAYISHHSALEFHGVGHQLFFEVYVSTEFEFKAFEFGGVTYRYCASKGNEGVLTYYTNRNVRVTDLERTVIDCIKNPNKAGGFEELLQCLRLITFLDGEKLMRYLKMYNIQFLYQKAGYILEHFMEELKLTEQFFKFCQQNIMKSKRYLGYNGGNGLVYNSKWRLMVPEDLLKFIEQGGNGIV
jgi:predicted transcriptional regulator of viral defense system